MGLYIERSTYFYQVAYLAQDFSSLKLLMNDMRVNHCWSHELLSLYQGSCCLFVPYIHLGT